MVSVGPAPGPLVALCGHRFGIVRPGHSRALGLPLSDFRSSRCATWCPGRSLRGLPWLLVDVPVRRREPETEAPSLDAPVLTAGSDPGLWPAGGGQRGLRARGAWQQVHKGPPCGTSVFPKPRRSPARDLGMG